MVFLNKILENNISFFTIHNIQFYILLTTLIQFFELYNFATYNKSYKLEQVSKYFYKKTSDY